MMNVDDDRRGIHPTRCRLIRGNMRESTRTRAKKNKNCFICKYPGTLEIHHIVPICKGGSNRQDNLQMLCNKCHCKIHRLVDRGIFNTTIEAARYLRRKENMEASVMKHRKINCINTKCIWNNQFKCKNKRITWKNEDCKERRLMKDV